MCCESRAGVKGTCFIDFESALVGLGVIIVAASLSGIVPCGNFV